MSTLIGLGESEWVDDETPIVPVCYIPSLTQVVDRLRGTPWSVAFYNACASPREPWLWLERGETADDYEVRRVVEIEEWY